MQSSDAQDQFVADLIRHQDQIYGFIAVLLPQRSDAEEVYQEVCLILWRKRDQFDASRPFAAWACGVARFEVLRFLRDRRKSGVYLSEATIEKLAVVEENSALDRHAHQQALEGCLGKLLTAQRELIERCYLGRESIKDVAEASGTTAAALYMKLARIRRTLLACIQNTLAETRE